MALKIFSNISSLRESKVCDPAECIKFCLRKAKVISPRHSISSFSNSLRKSTFSSGSRVKLSTLYKSLRISLYFLKQIKAWTTFGFKLRSLLEFRSLFSNCCSHGDCWAASADGRPLGLVTRMHQTLFKRSQSNFASSFDIELFKLSSQIFSLIGEQSTDQYFVQKFAHITVFLETNQSLDSVWI